MKTLLLLLSLILSTTSHALCVNSDKTRLRSRPDAKSKISWTVPKFMPLLQVDRKGAWIQVKDVDGAKHWVHAKYVSSKLDCAVVKAKTANLRVGPGTNFGITDLGRARKYSAFQKVDRDEEWLKLKDDYGQVHWAHENAIWEPRSRSRVSF
ncbi:MAG: hypothetical protein K2Q26_01995 [Bdellovibrionales bacterium]|nr:hypothetical protein [Bdellovibrionales bacterium]